MTLVRTFTVCLLLALTAGCWKKTQPAPAAAATPTIVGITGNVTYLERMMLPADSVVTVTLQDVSRADAPAAVIAQQVIRPQGQVPVQFALRYSPAANDTSRRYALRAGITDAQGELLWTTTEAYPVVPGATGSVDLIVRRAVANTTAAAPSSFGDEYAYKCNGMQFNARFQPKAVRLVLAERSLELPQVGSGSGARYSDGKTTFWSKGDEASLEIGGASYMGCKGQRRAG